VDGRSNRRNKDASLGTVRCTTEGLLTGEVISA